MTEKEKRYLIGQKRLQHLKMNSLYFGYRATEEGQFIAYLSEIDDFVPGIPEDMKWEYVVGKIESDGRCVVFAYIWFVSVAKAKEYAKRKGMVIEGGWYGY